MKNDMEFLQLENKVLKKRLDHLLESYIIREYDTIDPITRQYKLDIKMLDRFIANTTIANNELGGQLKPIHNNSELSKAMKNRRNCCLYTVGSFLISEENLYELKIKNIKLLGLSFAQLRYKSSNEKQQGKIPVNIVFDDISLNVNITGDIIKQIQPFMQKSK